MNEGATLVMELDNLGASPDAALWYYFADTGAWKLLIADRKVVSDGPRAVYRQVLKALQKLRDRVTHIVLEDVTVVMPDAPIIFLLRRALSVSPGPAGVRFSRNVIDGTMIEDAYIYRLKRPSA